MIRSRSRSRGGAGGGGSSASLPTFAAGYRMVGNTTAVDNTVSNSNNVRNDHKRVYIAETVTSSEIWVRLDNWYRSNVAAEVNGQQFDLNAAVVYNNTAYDLLIDGTLSSKTITGGASAVWAKVSGLTAMTAAQFLYVNTRRIYASGAVTKVRGQEAQARFLEGAIGGTSSSVDYTKNYGRGSTFTMTVSGGALSAGTEVFTNTSSNALYENGGSILAWQTNADGTITQRLIGTYTVTSGNPTAFTKTDTNTDWVTPTFVVLDQVSSFGAATGDIYGPTLVVAIPSNGAAKSIGICGDSNGHGTNDATQHANGYRGAYERGINGSNAVYQCSYSGTKASDLTAPGTSIPKTAAIINEWCTHVIGPLGTNDVPTDAAATIQTNLGTFATYWRSNGKSVAIPTIPPRTTSSDSFATTANQTPTTGAATGGVADQVNALIWDGTIVNDFGIHDLRTLMQAPLDLDAWRVDLGGVITDGTHLSQLGHIKLGANSEWLRMFADLSDFYSLPIGTYAWYDANDSFTITQAANEVSQWNDKSVNGFHATQSTATAKPMTNTVTINGLNALDFDGTNDRLDLPSGLWTIGGGANSMFVVYKSDNTGDAEQDLIVAQIASTGRRHGIAISTTQVLVRNRTTDSTATTQNDTRGTTAKVAALTRSGTTLQPIVSGVKGTAGTNAENTASITSMTIGSVAGGASMRFNGRIAEIIIFNSSVSDALANRIGKYVNKKFGVTWTGF